MTSEILPIGLKRAFEQKIRLQADEWGFLGVADGSGFPGTVEADGYIYDIPSKTGHMYCRILRGVSLEVGFCVARTAKQHDQKVGFVRKGGLLVAIDPDATGGVAGFGSGYGANIIPDFDASKITSGTLKHERGGLEADVSAYAGFLFISGGATSQKKANLSATAAPTTGDDSADGYSVGSLWIDVTNDNVYQAVDVSVGAAVWKQLDASGSAANKDLWSGTGDVTLSNSTTETSMFPGGTGSLDLAADWWAVGRGAIYRAGGEFELRGVLAGQSRF